MQDNQLNAAIIREHLRAEYRQIPISIAQQVASTNQTAREEARNGASHGSLWLAESQTAGRGRLGRSFFSPDRQGIYLSLLLRRQREQQPLLLLTTLAAVAVRRAVAEVCGIATQIKWVNDIYLRDRKLAGILAEGVIGPAGELTAVVLGIGLNFCGKQETYPPELQNVLTALYREAAPVSRNQLIAAIINQLLLLADQPALQAAALQEYRAHSWLLGQAITWQENGILYKGTALDIDAAGGLLVAKEDGEQTTLRSGEVTVRRQ
ncbi:MAG: biotin--[acetyl-CoA-carboxylase] ligase [Negativicutes bacterium]|nr:biotin--[acetyl-CoA-carboxylase] ligase [Negativicutes bacterium]